MPKNANLQSGMPLSVSPGGRLPCPRFALPAFCPRRSTDWGVFVLGTPILPRRSTDWGVFVLGTPILPYRSPDWGTLVLGTPILPRRSTD